MSAEFSWKWRAIIPFSAKEQDAVQSNTATRTQHGLKGPPEKKSNITKAQTSTIDKWAPRIDQPKKGKGGGPSGMAGRPPWSADQPMGPTTFRLRRGSSPLDGKVGSRGFILNSKPSRGWLPSINMRGGAPFQGVKEKIDEATLSRCSYSPLVEVLELEEFRFES